MLVKFPIKNNDQYNITNYNYGKNYIKLLCVEKDSPQHNIKEVEVDTRLKLNSIEDYTNGNNSKVIATDSQKNIVYLIAKKFGIDSIEKFVLILSNHFLEVYKQIIEVQIYCTEYPWKRVNENHSHAFRYVPDVIRTCYIMQKKSGTPNLYVGLQDMRVLKTTKSSFQNFVNDEYRTLANARDRVLSTVVKAKWKYNAIHLSDINFDLVFKTVFDTILETFAGPTVNGIESPSVQFTLYEIEKAILDKIPEVQSIEIEMPNKHYWDVDLTKFPKENNNRSVYQPVDKPSGMIYAELARNKLMSKI